jgi:prophage regulatory protein
MTAPLKILRAREVCARVGYSRMHLSRLEKAGEFPKRIQVGANRIGWLENEITDWILERAALREAG